MRLRVLRSGGLALALTLAATVAAAAEAADGSAYKPLPRTLLATQPELSFGAHRLRIEGMPVTRLAHLPAGAAPQWLADLSTREAPGRLLVCLELGTSEGLSPALQLATQEQLYALVLALDPAAHYAWTCRRDAGIEPMSHGAMLQMLASARERMRLRLGAAGQAVARPWVVVKLQSAVASSASAAGDADEVAARIMGAEGPLAGMPLHFNRAPHSSCVGTSMADGRAHCRLVDQHGDGDAHETEARAPVLVTFPGAVGAQRTLLPTTLLIDPLRPSPE